MNRATIRGLSVEQHTVLIISERKTDHLILSACLERMEDCGAQDRSYRRSVGGGLEALLRWNHPERGLLCPGEFLSTCEDMGLMKTIGYQVIQHVCSALVQLGERGMHAVDVAVNISFSQIQNNRFLEVTPVFLMLPAQSTQQ